jgi:dihydroanticapsin dehydrogenase
MSVVLIAGGATGIGLAALRAFRAQGDAVMLVDVDQASAERAAAEPARGEARAFICDLSDVDAPQAAVQAAATAFGGLDCVFVNAATLISASLSAWTIEQWNRSLALNLSAPFFLTQAAAPLLARSANGSVIFTSSTGALRGHAGMPAYHATKAGLLGLARSLADELAPQGVRVNCLLPGWIDTPFNKAFWAFQSDPAEAERALLRQIPMGRQGRPQDVVGAILFLASAASKYMTGTQLVVDGGYTAV